MDWKRFFDNLGLNGTRWQWRIMRWERNWQALKRGEGLSETVSVTRLLIAVNGTLFLAMLLQGLLTGYGLSAVMNPATELLHFVGAQYWPSVIDQGQWWRCLTYAYTHGGLLHIAFNMVALYQIGPLVEREIGPLRYFTLYTLTALTATLLGLLWHPMVPVVGASGALFGLIGFSAAYYNRIGTAGIYVRNIMLRWALFAFVFGFVVGADNAGHLGGAIGGALIGAILPLGVRGRQVARPLFNFLAAASAVATLASFGALFLSWLDFWRS
jgi:rhomboid protease GluP